MKSPTLQLLTYIVDMHDPYGTHHSERVAGLVLRLAKAYGIKSDAELDELEMSALLHDIGKVGIPEYIRRIPGKFTDFEYFIMQQHSAIGEKLLMHVVNGSISQAVKKNVRYHHENWGGNGYPDKISGLNIPLGARMIRICDTYDAMTNLRGFKEALSHTEALALMRDEQVKKILFDPELLKVFLADSFWKQE